MGPASQEAVPILKELLENKYQRVRVNAAGALNRINPSLKELILPVLAEGIKKKAYNAIEYFGEIGEDGVPQLISILKNKHKPAAIEAAKVLGEMGPTAKAALPTLMQMSEDASFPEWQRSKIFVKAIDLISKDGE